MLNINRRAGQRGLVVLLLLALLPLQVGAQQSKQDDKKRGKRPPLRVRVVTDSRVGVPVVVAPAPAAATAVVPTSANVQVVIENGVVAESSQPAVENWLVGGPAQPESWLTEPGHEPAAAAVAAPVAAPMAPQSRPLLGVQHYMESTQAERETSSSPAARQTPSVAVPPRPTGAIPAPAPQRPSTQPDATLGTYLLGPGDEIDVHVWRNPDLSRKVPVRPDGLISLPLAGEMLVSGKTVAQLNAEITTILGEYVQSPTVTVTVTQVRSMVVYVTGRVARAGTLALERPINVVQAITMAGGVQEFANRNGVVVIRTVNGKQVRIPFRYGDAVKGKGDIAELVLQSGDVVYVP